MNKILSKSYSDIIKLICRFFSINVILSVFLSCISLYCFYSINSGIENEDYFKFISVFLISLLRCILIFVSVDLLSNLFLKKRIKTIKFLLFLILVIWGLIQVVTIKMIGDTFKFSYLTLILEKEFIQHAGVSFTLIIYILIFSFIFIVFSCLLFVFSYKMIKPGEIKNRQTILFFILLFLGYLLTYKAIRKYDLITDSGLDSIPFKINSESKLITYSVNHQENKKYLKKFFTELNSSKVVGKTSLEELPNIILVMVESLRYDGMVKDLMKSISSHPGIQAQHNYTTSHCTHFAVFSILTGFFPTYYRDCIEENYCKATLLKILKKIGYKNYIISSVGMSLVKSKQLFRV